ncbi:MAG: methyltransferase domain-containing protein [Actinomycetota bacterium]
MIGLQHIGMFTTVDEAPDPGLLIGLLDRMQDAPDVQRIRAEALDALALQPGERVLDIGCGTGDHTREMAGLVAGDGEAVGVDFSHAMITEASRRQQGSGQPATFEQGDAQGLRFEAETFDACRSERMLCHVPDCRQALAEMVRVTRPGGRVAVIDADTGGVLIDSPNRALTEEFASSLTGTIQHPWIGRQLRRLFVEAGLVAVDVRPLVIEVGFGVVEPMIDAHVAGLLAAGSADPAAVEQWRRELEYANLAGTFFMAMTMVLAIGRKPGPS